MATVEAPDERALTFELNSARFLCGVEEGRWTVLAYTFPHLYVRVIANHPEVPLHIEQAFHLQCDGYPDPGPFVEAWSVEMNRRADPPSGGSPGFVDALKNWEHAQGVYGGVYRAWQRYAAVHNNWANLRPDQAWNGRRHITFIMERLYELVTEQVDWQAAKQSA